MKNQHRPGNMAVLVSAPCTGLRTFEDVIEASKQMHGELGPLFQSIVMPWQIPGIHDLDDAANADVAGAGQRP